MKQNLQIVALSLPLLSGNVLTVSVDSHTVRAVLKRIEWHQAVL